MFLCMTHAAAPSAGHSSPSRNQAAYQAPASLPDLWEWAACIEDEIIASWHTSRIMADNGQRPRCRPAACEIGCAILRSSCAALNRTFPLRMARRYLRSVRSTSWRAVFGRTRAARRTGQRAFSFSLHSAAPNRGGSHRLCKLTARERHSALENHAVCGRSTILRPEFLRRITAAPQIAARRVARTLAPIKARNLTASAPCISFLAPWISAARNE
jgi:hypothetical protein